MHFWIYLRNIENCLVSSFMQVFAVYETIKYTVLLYEMEHIWKLLNIARPVMFYLVTVY